MDAYVPTEYSPITIKSRWGNWVFQEIPNFYEDSYRDSNDEVQISEFSPSRPVVPGGARGAMAPPDFGRPVNPISTRRERLYPSYYYWHPQIFRPSYGPVIANFTF